MKELDIVCGAIQISDQFLIARRSKGADVGFWEFPGGKVEQKECQEEALIRELKEELGIEVRVIHKICSVDDQREDVLLHVHAFLCEIVCGTPILHVHDEMHLVNAKQLYQYRFQKADRKILDCINQK